MKKISIKDVVNFRNKSARSKQSFALKMRFGDDKVKNEGGGDYWISCISAVSNSYKQNNMQPVIDKRNELIEKYEESNSIKSKVMYGRNIDILYTFENLNLNKWRPSKDIKFMHKYREYSILTVKGLKIQVNPNHIFTFKKGAVEEIGAIWFVSKLNGFRKDELGMFTDVLYDYLNIHYSENYTVNPKYCIAIDIFNGIDVSYLQLEDGIIPRILNSTIDEMNALI